MGSTSFAYTANKLVSGATLPTGVGEHRTYDGASRMAHLDVAGPAGGAAPLASSYDYGYDPAGLTAAITGTLNGVAAAQELTHDARGYLTAAGGSSVSNWSYDQSGNLLTARSGSTNYTYGYVAGQGQVQPGPNQLVTLLVPFPLGGSRVVRTYHYNANGDVSEIDASGTLYLSYDSFSRLFDITRGGTTPGAVASMRYDAAGHRADYQAPVPATRTSPGGTKETLFSYTGDKVAQTVTNDTTAPTTLDRYSYRPDGSPLELLRTLGGVTTRYFYVVDGRRNVVALTDVGGNVVDRYSYDAWGVQLSVSEQVPQQLRYQGYWYDNEVGWYWLGTRYYDPTLGRFLQSDRSGKEGVYSYTYCNNDPVDCTDPQGTAGTSSAVDPGYMCNTASDPWCLNPVPLGSPSAYSNPTTDPYTSANATTSPNEAANLNAGIYYTGGGNPNAYSGNLAGGGSPGYTDNPTAAGGGGTSSGYTRLPRGYAAAAGRLDASDTGHQTGRYGTASILISNPGPGRAIIYILLQANPGVAIVGVDYRVDVKNWTTGESYVIENPITFDIFGLGRVSFPVGNAGSTWSHSEYINTGPGYVAASFSHTESLLGGGDVAYSSGSEGRPARAWLEIH